MTGTVLIVDDSLTVRMNLVEIFAAAGWRPTACANIGDAQEKLAGNRYALIILDVLLPDGDGVAFLHEIKAMPEASGMAVMMLSTEAEVRDRIRGLSTGADDYVGKPYDPDYIVARARALTADAMLPARATILVIDDSLTFREVLKDALCRAARQ